MALDALHQARILGGGLDDLLDPHDAGIVEDRSLHPAHERAGEVGGHEAAHIGERRIGDIGLEAAQGPGARAALIDDGGRTGMDSGLVRVDTEIGHPFVDMDMQVDQPGADQLAARIDKLGGIVRRQFRRDLDDAALGNGDFGGAAESCRRIDDVIADHHKVVSRPRGIGHRPAYSAASALSPALSGVAAGTTSLTAPFQPFWVRSKIWPNGSRYFTS